MSNKNNKRTLHLLSESIQVYDEETENYTIRKYNTSIKGIVREEPKQFSDFDHESFQVSEEVYNAEVVYVPVVFYSDGGTFGRTEGRYLTPITACLTLEKAQEALKEALDGTDSSIYCPWNSYFSSLERTEIYKLSVKETIANVEEKILQIAGYSVPVVDLTK